MIILFCLYCLFSSLELGRYIGLCVIMCCSDFVKDFIFHTEKKAQLGKLTLYQCLLSSQSCRGGHFRDITTK